MLEFDRPAGSLGSDGSKNEEELIPLITSAKAAANIGTDHANLVQRHRKHLGDIHPGLVCLIEIVPAGERITFPLYQAPASIQAGMISPVVI